MTLASPRPRDPDLPPALLPARGRIRVRPRLAVAGLGAVVVLLAGFFLRDSHFDLAVTAVFNSWHHGVIGTVADGVYAIFEPINAFLISLALALLSWRVQRSRVAALVFWLTVATTWLPVTLLKEVFTRPRPNPHEMAFPVAVLPSDWSFPSGHTAFITALMIGLILATRGTHGHVWAWSLAPVAIVGMAACVLIRGVHFPTDVLASMIWASTMAPAIWAALARAVAKQFARKTPGILDPEGRA